MYITSSFGLSFKKILINFFENKSSSWGIYSGYSMIKCAFESPIEDLQNCASFRYCDLVLHTLYSRISAWYSHWDDFEEIFCSFKVFKNKLFVKLDILWIIEYILIFAILPQHVQIDESLSYAKNNIKNNKEFINIIKCVISFLS